MRPRAADEDFGKAFGRRYGIMEEYAAEDADVLLVTSGTITGTARVVVDEYRKKGEKVGLLKMKMFRPFPTEEVRRVLQKVRKVAVIDRNISFGATGIFAQEIRSVLASAWRRDLGLRVHCRPGGKGRNPRCFCRRSWNRPRAKKLPKGTSSGWE